LLAVAAQLRRTLLEHHTEARHVGTPTP
jgi:hypothetical protein